MFWIVRLPVNVAKHDGSVESRIDSRQKYVFSGGSTDMTSEGTITSAAKSVSEFAHFFLNSDTEEIEIVSVGRFQKEVFEPMLEDLQKIQDASVSISEGEQQRLENLGVFKIQKILQATVELAMQLEHKVGIEQE